MLEWIFTKSQTMKQKLTACMWFSSFLLKELVSRAKRRIPIRIDRLARSTSDVLLRFLSGLPVMTS